MNVFEGHIINLQTEGDLTLVDVKVKDVQFTSVVIETPESAPFLTSGGPIQVMFKETEVSLSNQIDRKISLQNKLVCQITAIDNGAILSTVTMSHSIGILVSIVTTRAIQQLELTVGSEVLAMIKTNEVMLASL